MVKVGQYIAGSAQIPAGDAHIGKAVLSAPAHSHIAVAALNVSGGDANELVTAWIIPTMNMPPNANTKAGDISGSLQISSIGSFNLTNALGNTDSDNRAVPYAADSGRGSGMGTFPMFMLPAGYSLIFNCFTANAAVINISAGGFLCPIGYAPERRGG